LARCRLAQRSLSGRQARYWHAERRTGHVVEFRFVTEGNRCRIASMFTANTDFQLRSDFAAALDPDSDKFAYAALIDGNEWINGKYAARRIDAQKTRRVIARNPECRLR
jgi:hypothetical protein